MYQKLKGLIRKLFSVREQEIFGEPFSSALLTIVHEFAPQTVLNSIFKSNPITLHKEFRLNTINGNLQDVKVTKTLFLDDRSETA